MFGVARRREVGDALAATSRSWSSGSACPTRLSQVGVPEDGIPALVEGAMGDGTTLLNPRETTEEDYEELYRAALFEGRTRAPASGLSVAVRAVCFGRQRSCLFARGRSASAPAFAPSGSRPTSRASAAAG